MLMHFTTTSSWSSFPITPIISIAMLHSPKSLFDWVDLGAALREVYAAAVLRDRAAQRQEVVSLLLDDDGRRFCDVGIVGHRRIARHHSGSDPCTFFFTSAPIDLFAIGGALRDVRRRLEVAGGVAAICVIHFARTPPRLAKK